MSFRHPAMKYGISSPALSPIRVAPSDDRTGIRAGLGEHWSGHTSCTVLGGKPQLIQ